MSRIEAMIKKLCPNGVESRSIGSLIKRVRERGKNDRTISQVYVVSNVKGIVRSEDYHDNEIHSDDTSNYTVIRPGMFAYNPSRLNIGSLGLLKYSTPGLVSPMYVVFEVEKKVIDADYLFYNLKSSYVKAKIDSLKEEGARFRFDFNRWGWIKIPVPPLEVQREIVRILDKFTNLATELTSELAARKQQYDFYCDVLLNFNDESLFKEIGDVCTLSAGGDVPKNSFSETCSEEYPIPIISNGIGEKGFYGYTSTSRITDTCVTVAARGAGVGYVTYRDYPFFPIIRLVSVIPGEKVVAKYLYYAMRRIKFEPTKGGIPQLTVPMIAKYKVPVPSIEKQKQIADILDRFEKLCNDLSEGIPAEIAARQRQYQYYRDRLLSFKEV